MYTGPVVWNGTDLHCHSSGDRCRRCLVTVETLLVQPALLRRGLRFARPVDKVWTDTAAALPPDGTHIAVILRAVH